MDIFESFSIAFVIFLSIFLLLFPLLHPLRSCYVFRTNSADSKAPALQDLNIIVIFILKLSSEIKLVQVLF